MSSKKQWAIGLIVVIAVAIGVYWFSMQSQEPYAAAQAYPSDQQSNPSPLSQAGSVGASSTNTSSQALDNDTAAIDAQLQGIDADAANANQGVKDAQSQQ